MEGEKKVNVRAKIDTTTLNKLKELRILYSSKDGVLLTQEESFDRAINDAHAFRFATRLRGKNAKTTTT